MTAQIARPPAPAPEQRKTALSATRIFKRLMRVSLCASILSTVCFVLYLFVVPRLTNAPSFAAPLLRTLGLAGLGVAEGCQIVAIFVLMGQWAVRRSTEGRLKEFLALVISLIPFMTIVIFFVTLFVYYRARRRDRTAKTTVVARNEAKDQGISTAFDVANQLLSGTSAPTAAPPSAVGGPQPGPLAGPPAMLPVAAARPPRAGLSDALQRVVGPSTQRSVADAGNGLVSVTMISIVLATIATIGVVTVGRPHVRVNIVRDGGFEQPSLSGGAIVEYSAGQTFGNWTVESGSVDLTSSYWVSAQGAQSVDMSGSEAGTIYQELPTTSGTTYTLSFAVAGNPVCPPTIKQMQVWWGSGLVTTVSFDITGHSTTSMGWKYLTFQVQATSTVTRLRFVSLSQSQCGPALDDVSVM